MSATVPREVQRLMAQLLPDMQPLRTRTLHRAVAGSRHQFVGVPPGGDKLALALQLVQGDAARGRRVLMFAGTVDSCRALDHYCQVRGHPAPGRVGACVGTRAWGTGLPGRARTHLPAFPPAGCPPTRPPACLPASPRTHSPTHAPTHPPTPYTHPRSMAWTRCASTAACRRSSARRRWPSLRVRPCVHACVRACAHAARALGRGLASAGLPAAWQSLARRAAPAANAPLALPRAKLPLAPDKARATPSPPPLPPTPQGTNPAAPGAVPVMVCTDVTARGLDFPARIDHVVNFDFPKTAVDYLHRTGRTARAGGSGKVRGRPGGAGEGGGGSGKWGGLDAGAGGNPGGPGGRGGASGVGRPVHQPSPASPRPHPLLPISTRPCPL